MLEELQRTLLLDETQKDELFAHFASQAPASPAENPNGVVESQSEALSRILTEDQYRQWRQRTEMWAQFFRRARGGDGRWQASDATPAEK